MLKSPSTSATGEQQLLLNFVITLRLFLVAFSCLALFVVLFLRAVFFFISCWMACGNALCLWLTTCISCYAPTRAFAARLAGGIDL